MISLQVLAKKEQNTRRVYENSWLPTTGICKALAHLEPETYSELWPIKNPQTSKPCQTSTMERFEKQLTIIIIFCKFFAFFPSS